MKKRGFALTLVMLISCVNKKGESSRSSSPAETGNASTSLPAVPSQRSKPAHDPCDLQIAKKAGHSDRFFWEQHPHLTWNDFKGRPKRATSSRAAGSWTKPTASYGCRQNEKLHFAVSACFSPANSWVRQKTDKLLRHEQGHFDISELYARKIRKAFRDANISCEDLPKAKSAAKKIINNLGAEFNATQTQYDLDTTDPNDGIDPIKQDAASDHIAKELDALTAYKQDPKHR